MTHYSAAELGNLVVAVNRIQNHTEFTRDNFTVPANAWCAPSMS
jgi:hypothetical protein